jgi:hypothetical protein
MKRWTQPCLWLATALAAAFPIVAQADATASPTLTVQATAAGGGSHSVTLTAHLQDQSGSALTGGQVQFLIVASQFSDHPLLSLSSVSTDGQGVARYLYAPQWNGRLQFTALYIAADGTPVSATSDLAVSGVASAYHAPSSGPLSGVGTGLIVTLLAMVIAIWSVLLGLLVWVIRALPRRTSIGQWQDQTVQPQEVDDYQSVEFLDRRST